MSLWNLFTLPTYAAERARGATPSAEAWSPSIGEALPETPNPLWSGPSALSPIASPTYAPSSPAAAPASSGAPWWSWGRLLGGASPMGSTWQNIFEGLDGLGKSILPVLEQQNRTELERRRLDAELELGRLYAQRGQPYQLAAPGAGITWPKLPTDLGRYVPLAVGGLVLLFIVKRLLK